MGAKGKEGKEGKEEVGSRGRGVTYLAKFADLLGESESLASRAATKQPPTPNERTKANVSLLDWKGRRGGKGGRTIVAVKQERSNK